MSQEHPDETKVPQFEFRDTGEIHYNKKGQSTLLAKFNVDNGLLTFESFGVDQKYRTQILRAVTEDWLTGEQTGRVVRGYAIAGRPKDTLKKNEPPQPRKNPAYGDKTPFFVKWMFRHRPWAAYARYGVLLDSNNEPRTAHCSRVERGLMLPQEGDKPTEIGADGKDVLGVTFTEDKEGILAMRATCMTFTVKEIVGGSGEDDEAQAEEDMEPLPDGAEPEAVVDDDDDKPAKTGRRGKKSDDGDLA